VVVVLEGWAGGVQVEVLFLQSVLLAQMVREAAEAEAVFKVVQITHLEKEVQAS
jgi:hypothetical protein